MNSSLCWWFLKNTGTVLANGYFRYKPAYLFPFPLPLISEEDDCILKNLVEKRMKVQDLSIRKELESQINQYIYKIYGLDIDDIKIVER